MAITLHSTKVFLHGLVGALRANRVCIAAPRFETSSPSLRALTAAALALPGLTPAARAADGEEFSVQYGYYEEGERQQFQPPVGQTQGQVAPIRNDNLHATGRLTFFDRLKFAFNYIQDTWSGATPITTAPYVAMNGLDAVSGATSHHGTSPPAFLQSGTAFNVDTQLRFHTFNPEQPNNQRLVHMLASASPETRNQGDFSLGYEWDEAALTVGGGLSVERDYESRFANGSGRLDFNQKQTVASIGLSYTDSDIAAVPDSHGMEYIDFGYYLNATQGPKLSNQPIPSGGQTFLFSGNRRDWSANLGLTQVVNKYAVLDTGIGYTCSTGFLNNPYKAVALGFVDFSQTTDSTGLFGVEMQPVLEKRPDIRNQWTWNMDWKQYVPALDAAARFGYRFFHDDWGIDAHTLEADWAQPLGEGWVVTPRIRYYSQEAADFYQPFYLLQFAKPVTATGKLDFSRLPLTNYSSDHRLSGFGALSGGLTLSKELLRGAARLEAGVEYYTHQGGLKLGGGGEADFADFDSIIMNVALRVNLSPNSHRKEDGAFHEGLDSDDNAGTAASTTAAHAHHHEHTQHHGMHGPAGVMIDHMLHQAGDFMFGYRYMYSHAGGEMLGGTHVVGDAAVVANACGSRGCTFAPSAMTMHMHMLDIMYAPTDWLNLMLMPQFMDMNMSLRNLEGGVIDPLGHNHGSNASHDTGGIADTRVYSLFKLFDHQGQHMHLGLGVSAPTGEVGQVFADNRLVHYHMQIGSGTWDLLPSLTYTGSHEQWLWGAQVSGIYHLEDANASGFAFGDQLQGTAWAGYRWNDWLSTTVRGVYTNQDRISGGYQKKHDDSSPLDYPQNYGGHFWDVGFGLSAEVPKGDFRGNRLSVEWLQPVSDNVIGYQLERDGAFSATWGLMF